VGTAEGNAEDLRWPCGGVVEVLVIIQYSVLVVESG